MASLRLKDSKIPLRVDSRLKKISKIPLRVEAKPKILTSTEAELRRTSAVVRRKASINTIDRSKKSTKEIPKKELKPVNLQLKSKAKENRLQPSGKISQYKVHNNGPPKAIATDKGIKSSKPVSQALKDRNKIITKAAPEKHKPVKGKGKDDPFCSFKKKIPEINISDDPFKTHAEGKQIKDSNHPSQQDIEFVADDRMRNLILSNRELTPSILKSCSNIKTSIMERPSLYNRPKMIVDPYKQALADIENYNLASEGQRISEMQKNRLHASPLSKMSVDPYKQALADIANYDLASEGRRISEMQKNRLYASPLQNRNSLYKRMTVVGNPYEEALRSLKELRMHQKPKSCKKVTFKLSGEDRPSETEYRYGKDEKRSVKAIQPKLTDIREKSTGSSTGLTPEFEGNILLTSGTNPPKIVTVDSPSKPNEVFVNRQINDTCLPEKTEEQENDLFINNTSTSTSSFLKTVANNEKVNDSSPILYQSQDSDKNAAIFRHEIKNSILKTVNPFLNTLRTSEVRHSLFSRQSEHFLDKMNPKIFTPQPVSFYPRTNLPESFSPEFLSMGTTDILSCAPINTPLVLKRLGRQEQSPVCKKLEFKDSPKETNKGPGDSRENNPTFCLQNIMTQQKILDQLAHQECSIFMHEATFPCEIRNYLQNPIAQILNDGDEMHFVPVSLWRLS